jgi:predicted transposase YbfD/YdcC
VVKVKGNQPLLLREMKRLQNAGKHLDTCVTKEINRGRKEKRIARTYKVSKTIKENWPGSKTIIYLKRERKAENGASITHSYYLSSLNESAKEFAKGIRHHWGIENRLHYVKDVIFKEDESKIRSGNAPVILSLIRNLVINISRINGENRIKKFIRKCSGNIYFISKLLE